MGANKVLLIGTDTLSRITDWTDRNTAILFADGSGAAVIEAVEGQGEMLAWDIAADGSLEPLLYAEIGGFLHMDGKEVFRRAVRIMVDSAQKSLANAGIVLHRTGNTSSASIPLALFDAVDAGRLQRGDLVMMVGFGAGMTAASSIIRWNGKGLQ
jgi:3-oxoacyl-[acyl-carrier-protein] synthase-3